MKETFIITHGNSSIIPTQRVGKNNSFRPSFLIPAFLSFVALMELPSLHEILKQINLCYRAMFFDSFSCRFQKSTYLCNCVFHSIRFKVNKGWVKALTLFLCPYLNKQKTRFTHHENDLMKLQYKRRRLLIERRRRFK